jgi:hypothetical protein
MPGILGRLPVWAVGGIAALLLGLVAFGGYALVASRPHVSVASSAQRCGSQPSKLASLFSDGQTTMIRLSNPDYTDMHVLRTEPANTLSGMFDPLLSLSGDDKRLAYVTASDELLDDAHVQFIDVANPSAPTELAAIPTGLWVVKPAWSPDNRKLAFIKLNQAAGSPDQFELWIADTATQPVVASKEADIVADNFTNGNSASLCWTAGGRVVIVPSAAIALPSPSPSAASASPAGSPTPAPCGVPIFSQNDPAWRASIMQNGSDSIGGYGCALTSTAMLLNYYGSALTPAQLNSCLGAGADPIAWKSVPACTKGLISGGDRIDFTWTDLDALLASGRPAIVGMIGGLTGSHFVVVTSGGGGLAQNYRITDPWDATTYKTLGSYIGAGYKPSWIISYTGPGRNCARLIKGVAPAVSGIQDGGVSATPVTINIAPNLKNLKVFEILKLTDGTIPKDTFNQLLPFTKLTPGTTISDEGIYQVLLVTQAPSKPPHEELYKFTIDKTPPVVDLTLLNPRASGAKLGERPISNADSSVVRAQSYPLVDKPGKVRVATGDTLSGVQEIKTSLDGGALTEYSSDTTFNPVLVVQQGGDHSLKIQSFDAAGNMKEVTKYFTVYEYIAPKPTPLPPPTRCTTALNPGSFRVAANIIPGTRTDQTAGYWSATGGCPAFQGTIVGSYVNPLTGQLVTLPSHGINTLTGSNVNLDQIDCANQPQTSVNYTLTLSDSVGHSFTRQASVTVC